MVKNEILVKALALQGQIEGCCAKCGTQGQYLCTPMRLERMASVFYVFYECQAEGCGGFWRVRSTDVSKEGTALVADPSLDCVRPSSACPREWSGRSTRILLGPRPQQREVE